MGLGGRQGDNVTTTGGPERSLADPAAGEQIEYPIVVDRGVGELDGDGIVVEPETRTPDHPRRRTRAVIVGAVVAALVVAGVAIALANRDTGASSLRSVSAVKPPAAHPTPNKINPNPARIVTPAPPKIVHPKPANVTPPIVTPTAPVATPTAATPPPPPVTAPPVITPAVEPTSVLQWHATPASISVTGGGHKTFTVTVTNPTAGTVTLPQPLSCAPVLRGPKGVAFGFGVCVEMTQSMTPHQQLAHTYTVWATDSASAGGNALKAGNYTATIENLFTVPVHITAS